MLVLASWLGLAAAATYAVTPAPAYVAGDLIVKFVDASEAGKLLAQVVAGTKPTDAAVPIAARLSAELGVPLVAAQVTSGRELVMAIDRDKLKQAMTQLAGRDPAVRQVTPRDPPRTVLPAEQLVFAVELSRDSAAQRHVAQAAAAGRTTSPAVQKLVVRLTAGMSPQPVGRVDERGQLVLIMDIAVLTRDLVERLRLRADVEYAQVNIVLKPFGAAGKQ